MRGESNYQVSRRGNVTRALSDEITCLSRLKGALYSSCCCIFFRSTKMSSFFFFFFFLEQQTRRTISPRKFPLFLLLIESSKKINENTGIKRADSVENYINKGRRRLGEGKKNFEEKRVLKLGDEGSIVTNRDTVRTIDEKRNRERNAIESERVARETTPTGLCKTRIMLYVTNESEKKSRRY